MLLTLAVAPVKRAMPGVRLGPAGEAACHPSASRGEGTEGAAFVHPSMRSLYLQMLLVGALCAFVFIFAGDPVGHLLYGAGFYASCIGVAALYPSYLDALLPRHADRADTA
jgi:hypothetical protein